MEFHYLYFTVLLTRRNHQHLHHRQTEDHDHDEDDDCIEASRRSLSLLDTLVSDSRDVYNGIVWQLLFEPFTPFFALLDHIRVLAHARERIRSSSSTDNAKKQEDEAATVAKMKESVDAMECLRTFLDKMTTRHPLAEKLRGVASEHLAVAHRLVAAKDPEVEEATTSTSVTSPQTLVTPQTHSSSPLLESTSKQPDFFPALGSLDGLDYNFNLGGFDWFEWDSNINYNYGIGNVRG